MRILFFISVHGHGRGGHFHSLNHITRKIGLEHEIKIISIGPGKSEVIESNPYFFEHIFFSGFNFFKLLKEIKKIRTDFKPNIYHCFDEDSYNILRLFISTKLNKIIVNKCGGPNPKKYAHIPNLILFSQENLDWYDNQKKFKNTNLDLIPNRVKAIVPDLNFQPIIKDKNIFIFVRVCRIGKAYEKSIKDSINLIELLINKNITSIKLYLIGVVEDTKIFSKLIEHELVEKGYIIFLKEEIYTNEASKMLYLADAVIGTGRGLMESASLNIPILTINSKFDTPVLLNNEYFFDAFRTNFSERNIFSKFNETNNQQNIINLVCNSEFYSKMSKFSSEMFDKYFNLDKVVELYPKSYNKAKNSSRKILSDILIILHSFFNFKRSYIKSKIN